MFCRKKRLLQEVDQCRQTALIEDNRKFQKLLKLWLYHALAVGGADYKRNVQ